MPSSMTTVVIPNATKTSRYHFVKVILLFSNLILFPERPFSNILIFFYTSKKVFFESILTCFWKRPFKNYAKKLLKRSFWKHKKIMYSRRTFMKVCKYTFGKDFLEDTILFLHFWKDLSRSMFS